jgi:hypothetical protein
MLRRVLSASPERRKKILPGLVAISLLAGLIVSIIVSHNAQADYATGCGYGYNSSASGFGSGAGAGHAYGYLANGSFGYGYGNEVCPLAITTTSLPGGSLEVPYFKTLTGTGGTGTFTWTLAGGAFPNGLGISGQAIQGNPTATGTFNFTVKMTDGNGQSVTSGPLSITIASSSGTTTTTSPSTHKPALVYVRVVGHATATGIRLQFRCANISKCTGTGSLSALLHVRTRSGFTHVRKVLATGVFSIGKGQTGNVFFGYTPAGVARLGGHNYYHHFGLRLVTHVDNGNGQTLTVYVSRFRS